MFFFKAVKELRLSVLFSYGKMFSIEQLDLMI